MMWLYRAGWIKPFVYGQPGTLTEAPEAWFLLLVEWKDGDAGVQRSTWYCNN